MANKYITKNGTEVILTEEEAIAYKKITTLRIVEAGVSTSMQEEKVNPKAKTVKKEVEPTKDIELTTE